MRGKGCKEARAEVLERVFAMCLRVSAVLIMI